MELEEVLINNLIARSGSGVWSSHYCPMGLAVRIPWNVDGAKMERCLALVERN